jgi:hypothetical protein
MPIVIALLVIIVLILAPWLLGVAFIGGVAALGGLMTIWPQLLLLCAIFLTAAVAYAVWQTQAGANQVTRSSGVESPRSPPLAVCATGAASHKSPTTALANADV